MPRKPDPNLDVACTQCGVIFHTSKQRLRKNKKGNFCSLKCYDAFRRETGYNKPPPRKDDPSKTLNLVCSQCGKEFKRKIYNIKPSKYGVTFCSRKCAGHWRSENLTGEDSPNWKGGYHYEYGGSHWKRQRRLARERDHHICQDCGITEQEWGYKLDVHHIVAYDLFDDPKDANHLNNLVTLCRKCHSKYHNNK